MKKRIISGLLILVILAAFTTTALAVADSGISVLSSAAATWTSKTISQTSQSITYGTKSDTASADVYISSSSYPYSTDGMDVRIYDYSLGQVASMWTTYYYWGTSNGYQYRDIPYTSGRAISGSVMYLNLKIPSSSSLTGLTTSGKFYP